MQDSEFGATKQAQREQTAPQHGAMSIEAMERQADCSKNSDRCIARRLRAPSRVRIAASRHAMITSATSHGAPQQICSGTTTGAKSRGGNEQSTPKPRSQAQAPTVVSQMPFPEQVTLFASARQGELAARCAKTAKTSPTRSGHFARVLHNQTSYSKVIFVSASVKHVHKMQYSH